jgi:hypothetical protein
MNIAYFCQYFIKSECTWLILLVSQERKSYIQKIHGRFPK